MEIGSGVNAGQSDHPTEQQKDENELWELRRERAALQNRLTDAEAYLVECGYTRAVEREEEEPEPVENRLFTEIRAPESAGRHAGKLLGRERTDEWEMAVRKIFQFFDIDDDGCWAYDEFRSYLGYFGRLHTFDANALLTAESWSMYMADAYRVDEDGSLTFRGFVGYMKATEEGDSLLNDVCSLGLEDSKEALERWGVYKREFDKLSGGEDTIATSEFQLLLYNVGAPMSHLECKRAIKNMLARAQVLWPVRKPRHRRKFDARSELTLRNERPDLHPSRLFRKIFLAWAMSNRPTFEMGTWRKRLINFKCSTKAKMRRAASVGSQLRSRVLRCAERGMLTALNDAMTTLTTIDLVADVGERHDSQLGVNVSVTTGLDNGLRSIDAPYGSRAALILDLLVRGDTPPPIVVEARDSFYKFVMLHLQTDFEAIHVIHSFNIEVTENDDGAPVLRCFLFLRSNADPDRLLSAAHLIIGTAHFFRSFRAEFTCGLSLPDLFENRRTVLSQDFNFRSSLNTTIDSSLLGKLLQEISCSMDDEATGGGGLHAQAEAADKHEPWQQTWRDKIALNYRDFRNKFRRFTSFISHCNGATMHLRCDSLLELIAAKYVEETLPRKALHQLQMLVTQPGQATLEFQNLVRSFTEEMVSVGERVLVKRAEEELMEAQKRVKRRGERLKENRRVLHKAGQKMVLEDINKMLQSGVMDEAAAAAAADERLQRQRDKKKKAQEAEAYEKEAENRISTLLNEPDKNLRNKAVDSDLAFLEVYARGWHALLGPLGMRFQTDKLQVDVQFNAFDIFELLPEPESIMEGL